MALLVCSAVFLVSVAALLFFGLFWMVNFDKVTSGVLTPLRRLVEYILSETPLQFFKDISKDKSTITPIIGLIVFGNTARASWKILIRPGNVPDQVERNQEKFPFPANHQVTWVQLGLLGTLWGFLLIGNKLTGSTAAENVVILVEAFDTALLSTFSGVVAAYVIGPSISGVFSWLAGQGNMRPSAPLNLIDDLMQKLDGLAVSAENTSRTLSPNKEPLSFAPRAESRTLLDSVVALNRAIVGLEKRLVETDFEEPIERIVDHAVATVTTKHGMRVREFEENMANQLAKLTSTVGDNLKDVANGLLHAHERLAQSTRAQTAELHQSQQAAWARQHSTLLKEIADLINALRDGKAGIEESISDGLERIAGESHRARKDLERKARHERERLLVEVKRRLDLLGEKVARLEREPARLTLLERLTRWLQVGKK